MSLSNSILGFLSYSSMSGYDLAKAFDSSVRFFWYAQNSQIYLELDKLEKKGFVTHEIIPQTDRPNKKLYTITDSGKKELLDWLADGKGETSKGMKNTFMMKMFFSGWITPQESIRRLKSFCKDTEDYLAQMDCIPESISYYGSGVADYTKLYWEMTSDYGYCFAKMNLEWAQRCIKKLEEMEK